MDFKFKVLSLKRRKDRQESFSELFKSYKFEFFWGIDGKEYKLTEADKQWIKNNNFRRFGIHIPSYVATNRSHLKMLENCIEDKIPYVIFEDDTKLLKPIDFKFEDIVRKNLDVFWLMPDKPSILAYIVWPSGAKKLIDAVDGPEGLAWGLDYMWHFLKGTGYLNEEQLWDDYFWQVAADENSDISYLLYNGGEKRFY